jgi:Zn-dependent protease with chaperone function
MTDSATACPTCAAGVVHDPGFAPWCRACGWHVDPLVPRDAKSRLDRLNERLGRRQGRALFEATLKAADLRPRASITWVLAVAIAGAVLLIHLSIVVVGAFLVVSMPGWLLVLLGIGMVVVGVASRPSVSKTPTEDVIGRADAPALWGLIDRLARELGVRPPDVLVVDGDWNASVTKVGWRQRTVLQVGQLVLAMTPRQARVALVAHELAHLANRDPARIFLIHVAIVTLADWSEMLEPDELAPSEWGLVGLLMFPVNVLLLAASLACVALALGLLGLLFRDSQRAEYYADRLAADVAGSAAMIEMLETLRFGAAYEQAVQNVAITNRQRELTGLLREYIAATPPNELERMGRAGALEASRLDHTHPPTTYRVRLLAEHPRPEPRVSLDGPTSATIDAELDRLAPAVQRKLVADYVSSLHG